MTITKRIVALLLVMTLCLTAAGCKKDDGLAKSLLSEEQEYVTPLENLNNSGQIEPLTVIDMEPGTYDPAGLMLFSTDGSEASAVAYEVEKADHYSNEAPQGYVVYRIVLKSGLVDQAGNPIDAEKVIASFLDACGQDEKLAALEVMGLRQYMTGIPDGCEELVDKVLAYGINPDASFPRIGGVTPAEQNSVWSLLDEAGELFAQDIIDFVNAQYASDQYVSNFFSEGMTYAEVAQDDDLRTAYAFVMWGYGRDRFYYNSGNRMFTDCYMNDYDLDREGVHAADLWRVIKQYHGYDLSKSGINYEKPQTSPNTIQDWIRIVYLDHVRTTFDTVTGVKASTTVSKENVKRDCIYVTVGSDVDIHDFNFSIAGSGDCDQ